MVLSSTLSARLTASFLEGLVFVMVDFFDEQKFRYLDAAAAASLLSISRLKSSMNEVKTPCL